MIVIIDYGMGNLHSVYNAVNQVNGCGMISNKIEDIEQADGIILPGVGAFYDCMKNLSDKGLIEAIKRQCNKKVPILGICLGMQVLFERGYEGGVCNGLGFLKGEIQPMVDCSVKIPHMGWNRLEPIREDRLLPKDKKPFVYFVHSFFAQNYSEEDLVAYSCYGNLKIPAYVRKDNIFGMQYHPEKSGEEGLNMLNAFVELCKKEKEYVNNSSN